MCDRDGVCGFECEGFCELNDTIADCRGVDFCIVLVEIMGMGMENDISCD